MKEPITKQKIIICILSILLVIALIYILFNSYQNAKLNILKQGVQFGYEQAVSQLLEQSETCQPISIQFQNKTKALISLDCLKIPQSQEAPNNDTSVQ